MNQRPEYDARKTGENLKRLRMLCGYTAEAVREYIGVGTVQSVYKWERGDCFPTLDNFLALAELYGVDPMEIVVRRKVEHLIVDLESCGKKQRTHPLVQYYCRISEHCQHDKAAFGIIPKAEFQQ